ncbi:MAG: c-type cytochrome [Nitrococcus sp.]|nr:c-type cytochrome [Nitrococcus sp.]
MTRIGPWFRVPVCAAVLSLAAAGCGGAPPFAAAAPPPGDPAAGKRVYVRCIGCHSPARNRTGPRHCGLFGRLSGTVPGFDYSAAMKKAAITWNAETLDWFLLDPMEAIPGTSMTFAGVKDARERRNLIAYLATLDADSQACRSVAAKLRKEG